MTDPRAEQGLTAEHPKDICECGDYRRQHTPGCVYGAAHPGDTRCDRFVLSRVHAPEPVAEKPDMAEYDDCEAYR